MASNQQSSENIESTEPEIPAEHVISAATRRRLQQCFEHGQKLLSQEKRDHDYANTMFTECVVKDPSNLVYVEAFLNNLQDKYKNNKRGARFALGGGRRSEFKKALAKKNWAEVLALGPEILRSNPWDVPTLRAMAQACEAFHYNEVELRYLKNALDANPKDVEVNRHCARSLSRMGQFDQAIACWHRIEELRPNDPEAPKMIADLTVERSRAAAGFGSGPPTSAAHRGARPGSGASTKAPSADGGSTAAPAESAAKETAEPAAKREIQLTPIQRLEKAISDDPTMVENYLELIDLYVEEQRFSDAERVLHRAQSAAGADMDVMAKAEDFQIARHQHQLKVAEQRAKAERTSEARELVDRLREQLARVELEVFDARSQRFPEDLQLKFRVGQCLKKVGNYREAALRFQEARKDDALCAEATLELGECLQHAKQYVKALHCYQRAAEKASQSDEADSLRKRALYRAGVLASGLKEWSTAENHLRQLASLDPHYKDVQARLDKIRSIGDKG